MLQIAMKLWFLANDQISWSTCQRVRAEIEDGQEDWAEMVDCSCKSQGENVQCEEPAIFSVAATRTLENRTSQEIIGIFPKSTFGESGYGSAVSAVALIL